MSMMSMEAVFPAIGGITILVTVTQPLVFSGTSGKSVGAAVPAPGATVGATVGVGQLLAAAVGATVGAGGAALGDGAAAGAAHEAAKIVAKSTPDNWMERERVMATPHASLSRRARTIYARAGERAVGSQALSGAVGALTTFRSQWTTICSHGCVTGARTVRGAREGADRTLQRARPSFLPKGARACHRPTGRRSPKAAQASHLGRSGRRRHRGWTACLLGGSALGGLRRDRIDRPQAEGTSCRAPFGPHRQARSRARVRFRVVRGRHRDSLERRRSHGSGR